ncbi:antiterminator Q family protein [Proteus hauseri]|uniref:antiterminator Q family protein n=1 Tax=Proteus hauseri TaxID=183417 RepID=UPI0032DB7D32
MKDISKMMKQWGTWMINNNKSIQEDIKKSQHIIPERIKSRRKSNEDQAQLISEFMTNLLNSNKEDYDLLLNYYVYGKTFIQLAKFQQCSDTYIGKKLKKAEGVIEGMLIMNDIKSKHQ